MLLKLGIPGQLENATIDCSGAPASTSPPPCGPTSRPSMTRNWVHVVRAQEMARFVEDGVLDAGLTEQDWVAETEADVEVVADLVYAKQSFGRFAGAGGPGGLTARSLKDLEGKSSPRNWSKPPALLQRNGVRAKVEFSWGATEVKPPSWRTPCGGNGDRSSLRANKLRIVEEVCSPIRSSSPPRRLQDVASVASWRTSACCGGGDERLDRWGSCSTCIVTTLGEFWTASPPAQAHHLRPQRRGGSPSTPYLRSRWYAPSSPPEGRGRSGNRGVSTQQDSHVVKRKAKPARMRGTRSARGAAAPAPLCRLGWTQFLGPGTPSL